MLATLAACTLLLVDITGRGHGLQLATLPPLNPPVLPRFCHTSWPWGRIALKTLSQCDLSPRVQVCRHVGLTLTVRCNT
jgi:hypothetical protein